MVNGQSINRTWLRALELTAPITSTPSRILPVVIESIAEDFGQKAALISEPETFNFHILAERANRYARWALDQGLLKGDAVCLIMLNRPEYMAIWLGLTRVGVVVSLINTQLRGASLAHCINIVEPKHIISSAELSADIYSASAQFTSDPRMWSHGQHGFDRIDHAVESISGERLTRSEHRPVTIADRALTIYTSGTTGLPKAAYVSHYRLMQWSFWFAGLMNTGADDRMFDCLPMYHSTGGIIATGAVLVRGGSVLIREKFSARRFWDDVVDWDCTIVQYIGELCRYLVNAPEHARERAHRLRICCGNGLKADVWNKFKTRFMIPRILEFYAATEGNVSLCNVEEKIGAVGRVPSFLAHRFPLALVKFDVAKGEPARGVDGFCLRVPTNEVGEALGQIRSGTGRGGELEGYGGAKDTEEKSFVTSFSLATRGTALATLCA